MNFKVEAQLLPNELSVGIFLYWGGVELRPCTIIFRQFVSTVYFKGFEVKLRFRINKNT